MALIILFFVSLLFGQLGAMSPLPDVYVYVHDVVLAVFVLFYFLRSRNSKFAIHTSPLFWPIVAFLGTSVLSIVANANRLDQAAVIRSLLYIARWGYYAFIYFIVASTKRPFFWLKGLYAAGVGFAIIGLVQFFLYPNLRNLYYLGWDPHYYRVFSTLLDPNFAGIIFVLTLFLGIAIQPHLKSQWVVPLFSGVIGVALFLTFSRSSILALLAGLVFWIIKTRKWRVAWIGFVVVAIAIAIPKPGGETLRILRPESTMARIVNWQESLQLIATSPIVGHGFYALPQTTAGVVSRAVAYLDNSLLFVFATTGAIGLASYLWLLRGVAAMMESVKDKRLANFRIVGLMSLISLLIHSMFVNSLFYAWTMVWLWVLVGVAESSADI